MTTRPHADTEVPEPTASVIIPCYNQGHFLAEAIESALQQRDMTVEVIVVDDGSTDETAQIASRYPEVELIRQRNRGLAAARNRGLAASRGRFSIFLDADDRLLPDSVSTGAAALEERPDCAFAYGQLRSISPQGVPLGSPRRRRIEQDHYRHLLAECFITNPAMVMYRRAVVEEVGGFVSTRWRQGSEDYDLYLRITRIFPVYCHHEVVVERRRHPGSMSRRPQGMLRHILTVHRRQWRFAKHDPGLRDAYLAGRRHYRLWYGEPLVTETHLLLRAGRWPAAISRLWTLARFHRAGLRALLKGLPDSNRVLFPVVREESGSVQSPPVVPEQTGLAITRLDPDHALVGTAFHRRPGGGITLQVSCRGASRWTTVIFGDQALETRYQDDSALAAEVPDELLRHPGVWPVYLLK